MGEGKEKIRKKRLEWEREPKHKRLLNTENKQRVSGGVVGGGMGEMGKGH